MRNDLDLIIKLLEGIDRKVNTATKGGEAR
jgi:hypothetical protein